MRTAKIHKAMTTATLAVTAWLAPGCSDTQGEHPSGALGPAAGSPSSGAPNGAQQASAPAAGLAGTSSAPSPSGGAAPSAPSGPSAGGVPPTAVGAGDTLAGPPQSTETGAPSGPAGGSTAAGGGAAPGGSTLGAAGTDPGVVPGATAGATTVGAGSVAPGTTEVGSSGCALGYSELPNGADGVNVEQVCYPEDGVLDRSISRAAFETTLYPLLRDHCATCHSTLTHAQAPIHSDGDLNLAHEYALTRVDFREPERSKFVVRMGTDRHNCFGDSCADARAQMLAAVEAWAEVVAPTLPETPRGLPADEVVTDAQVSDWAATDRATLPAADAEFMKYASLHEMHNQGATAEELNIARVALSKALNSVARWAPAIVNPVDINGLGLVYRFDIRSYWGYNKGVTRLLFGGSDDDLVFGSNKTDVEGNPVDTSAFGQRYNFSPVVSEDPDFARMIWKRVLYGNVEGAVASGSIPANIDGFHDGYVEAMQLVYTLSRPDVYNAIMAIPWYATELEDELGVVRDDGMDSYEYMVTEEAITVDARLYFRARTETGGFYWKTFDIFTGQVDSSTTDNRRFPFWANPIPQFVSATGFGQGADTLSFIATLWQPTADELAASGLHDQCAPQASYGGDQYQNCRYFTGSGGLQQSAEESIWNLPNGLQGYALFGGFNQRRVDAFTNIVRDPRILRNLDDETYNNQHGFTFPDLRLNEGGSCMGCHRDGLNRGNNDLRDWLDEDRLPTGKTGADSWIDDEATKERVRELYPPSDVMRPRMEDDRRLFLEAMNAIRQGMVLGPDKNIHVEPIVWSFEWAQGHYDYAATRSN